MATGMLPNVFLAKQKFAANVANKDVVEQYHDYKEKVIEFTHDDLDRDIRKRCKSAMKIRKNADVYDNYIEWMSQVNETQIYDA